MFSISEETLKNIKRIHFIGIGGSGMYPIAQILHGEGFQLTGSDNNETDTLKAVRGMGIPVTLGHFPESVEGAELVVYTAAIMKDNPELTAARQRGIPVIERSEMLGLLSRRFGCPISVAGTHGKTTTASMITHILFRSGFDPSAVIGGKLASIGGSGRVGKSDLFVVEACEFVDTFLKLKSSMAVILNIDADHLDYFGTLQNIIASFRKFAGAAGDCILYNGDDANSEQAVVDLDQKKIRFGLSDDCEYRADKIEKNEFGCYSFDLVVKKQQVGRIDLHIPGRHNIYNALASCAVCMELGVTAEQIDDALIDFKGAKRRFEILGVRDGVTIADDYAHHPAELEATLTTAMGMNYKTVWAVFQPFTYSRTALLFDDFVRVLKIPDKVVLSEIMGGREQNTYNIFSKDLAQKIDGSVWFSTFGEITDYVLGHAKEGDLVITLGCGDINKAAHMMIER